MATQSVAPQTATILHFPDPERAKQLVRARRVAKLADLMEQLIAGRLPRDENERRLQVSLREMVRRAELRQGCLDPALLSEAQATDRIRADGRERAQALRRAA